MQNSLFQNAGTGAILGGNAGRRILNQDAGLTLQAAGQGAVQGGVQNLQPAYDPAAAQAAADAAAEAERQAAIKAQADPLLKALSGLDTTLSNRLSGVDQRYNQQMAQYRDASRDDRAQYDRNVSTNEQQLMGNRQSSLLQGARLNQNLNSVLASMGALSGTGRHLAGEAVQGITNRSLGDANETFTENSTTINDAWREAEREHRQREEDAKRIRADERANVRADVLTNRQKILNQLGNIYGSDTSEGARYLGQAGQLYGQIANTTRPNVAQYQRASSAYSPGQLESYLSSIGNTEVQAAGGDTTGGGTPINSPLFARNDRRRDERLV